MSCEKCGVSEFTCDPSTHEEGGPHPQTAYDFVVLVE